MPDVQTPAPTPEPHAWGRVHEIAGRRVTLAHWGALAPGPHDHCQVCGASPLWWTHRTEAQIGAGRGLIVDLWGHRSCLDPARHPDGDVLMARAAAVLASRALDVDLVAALPGHPLGLLLVLDTEAAEEDLEVWRAPMGCGETQRLLDDHRIDISLEVALERCEGGVWLAAAGDLASAYTAPTHPTPAAALHDLAARLTVAGQALLEAAARLRSDL